MVEKYNPAKDLSFQLAIDLVQLCQSIQSTKQEYILTKQLIRSSTSIGANLEEAIGGRSDKDFLSKISIAYKESREASYWLKLLSALNYISPKQLDQYNNQLDQILRILGASMRTLKKKINARSE